jgi:predicted enzyme related to lactoylglutathione lyase
MIKKLTLFVTVKDQDKSLEFYGNALGFEKLADYSPPGNPRWLTVSPKVQDIELALYPLQPDARAVTWTLVTDDIRKDFDELKSRGIQFEEAEPKESPWGKSATFSDPDGNKFSLYQQSPVYVGAVKAGISFIKNKLGNQQASKSSEL